MNEFHNAVVDMEMSTKILVESTMVSCLYLEKTPLCENRAGGKLVVTIWGCMVWSTWCQGCEKITPRETWSHLVVVTFDACFQG